MADRPILFSGEMVRAILDGRKTQTRRVVKWPVLTSSDGAKRRLFTERDVPEMNALLTKRQSFSLRRFGPFGQVGDRLWVRETWAGDDMCGTVYRADHPDADIRRGDLDEGEQTLRFWRPSIHMPRWASRITLEVTGVRVERVQDISEEDVSAEGVDLDWERLARMNAAAGVTPERNARAQFAALWDSINAKRAPWSANPWVWVVSFKVVQP